MKSLRLAPLATAVTLALAAIPAHAQQNAAPAADAPLPIHIATQGLAQALNDWARQTRYQLVVQQAAVAGKTAPVVSGTLNPRQALNQLLAGSGLFARFEGNLATIEPLPEGTSGQRTLSAVTVTAAADRETPTGPLAGYVAKRSAGATKTDTLLIDTPQSISVVTNDELRNRQAETLSQALNYTPGFTSQPTSFNRTADRFRIRGMDVESATSGSLRDGLRLQSNSYDGIQEPYGLERVEVIRGAASVLYGQLSPGGVINAVSKRPVPTPIRELNLQAGSHDRKQVSGDFSGPLAGSDSVDYRVTFLNRDSNTSQNQVNDDRFYIAPALTWKPDADTSLTLLSFYQKTNTRFSAPLPFQLVDGLATGPFRIGRDDFIGEPAYDEMKGEMFAAGYEFAHRVNDRVSISHKLRYFDAKVKWNYLQAQTTPASILSAANTGILQRQYSDRREHSKGLATDSHVESKWDLLGAQHTVLLGLDAYKTSYDSKNFRGNAPTLDLRTYAYGKPVVVNDSLALDRGSKIDTVQTGIYLQDQIALGEQWSFVIGGRQDWADQDQTQHRNGAATSQNNEATTWRAGLVYKTANGWAPYVSYSESFFPVSVADAGGQSFSPTSGKQYEAGVRYQPAGSNLLVSAALYELTQTNVLKLDASTGIYRQAGEVRSRGFELEAKADVTRELSVIASYAYTDARTTRSTVATEIGQRSEDTPRHQAALWADYSFGRFGLPQLKVGGGARFKGSTQPSGISTAMPAYTLFDAMLSYNIDRNWDVTVNVSNLTNRQFTYCEFAICRYGDERQVTGTVSWRW